MADNDNVLRLPWKFKHAEGLNDYGDIVDSEGSTVVTGYAIFNGDGLRARQMARILEAVNPSPVPESPKEEA